MVENSGAEFVFADKKTAELVAPYLPEGVGLVSLDSPEFGALCQAAPHTTPEPLDPADLAWLFYTSGTTGRPKGVMLTCGNLASMALSYFVDVDDVKPQDAILYAAPMSHGAGLYNFMHVMKGSRHVVPVSGGFDAAEILQIAPVIGSISMFAAPTMVRRLVDVAKASGALAGGCGPSSMPAGLCTRRTFWKRLK